MKIEIACLTIDSNKRSGLQRIVITVRVPRDIKVLCFQSIMEILSMRQKRINILNEYRKLMNRPKLNNLPGIPPAEKKEDRLTFSIVSWSPIINVDKLEILQKYL